MTIIFSNHGDQDTSIMPCIWDGIPDTKVVEVREYDTDYEQRVDEALAAEDDMVILCGHGSVYGLLHPDFMSGHYLVHENNVHLIHAKKVIGIFCFASEFASRVNLSGFFTSMFISNVNEACDNGYFHESKDFIARQNEIAYLRIRQLILSDIPMYEWPETMVNMAITGNECLDVTVEPLNESIDALTGIIYFNYRGMEYRPKLVLS